MWLELLNILCVSLPILAFVSPGTVFIGVFFPSVGRRTDENDASLRQTKRIEMPPLAVTTQMLQCYLFGIYAHHLSMRTLLIPNVVGFMLGLLWSTLYPFKMAPDFRLQWRVQFIASLCLMALGTLTIHNLPYLSSSVAAVVGIVMCSYPLPEMKRAYVEMNADLLGSAFMNTAMLGCCASWVIHSSPLVEYDAFVLAANSAGVLVQAGALIVRVSIARRRGASGGEREALMQLSA